MIRNEYDFQNDRIRPTRRIAVFAVVSNLWAFTQIPLQYEFDITGYVQQSKSSSLYVALYKSMAVVRTAGSIIILILYWWHRHEIAALLADFQRLRHNRLKIVTLSPMTVCGFRNALLRKIAFGWIAGVFRLLSTAHLHKWRDRYNFITVSFSLSIQSQVFNHIFLISCACNLYLEALNDEIRRIVNTLMASSGQEPLSLFQFRRRRRSLIRKFNSLIMTRKELQRNVAQFNKILGVQVFCVICSLYLYNIGIIYTIYSLTKPNEAKALQITSSEIAVFLFGNFMIFVDVAESVLAIKRLQANFTLFLPAMRKLLELRQLDDHWKRSLEQIYLYEKCNPFRPIILGMIPLDGEGVLRYIASTLSNSIILVQYDYANF
ncbi:putative gustatory receptor 36a [Eurosta solidaginis]|uniref:putative gustatory receptor 36a n=1 Tax=Eurosta solidaginis TaxID=178769 RepID=UPI00353155FB